MKKSDIYGQTILCVIAHNEDFNNEELLETLEELVSARRGELLTEQYKEGNNND